MNDRQKIRFYDTVRALAGYVENGTSDTVKFFQDDVTKTWHIEAGKQEFWGESIPDLIEKAATWLEANPE